MCIRDSKNIALAELRNPVTPCINNTAFNAVTGLFQFLNHASHDEHFIVQSHVWNIFHDNGFRTSKEGYFQIRTPKVSTLIVRITHTFLNKIANAITPSFRKRLTWRSAR